MNRRDMLKMTGAAVAGTSLFGLDAVASERNYREEEMKGEKKVRKAMIFGAHPDDPETGCGGTMIKLKNAGFEVVSVYLTERAYVCHQSGLCHDSICNRSSDI